MSGDGGDRALMPNGAVVFVRFSFFIAMAISCEFCARSTAPRFADSDGDLRAGVISALWLRGDWVADCFFLFFFRSLGRGVFSFFHRSVGRWIGWSGF